METHQHQNGIPELSLADQQFLDGQFSPIEVDENNEAHKNVINELTKGFTEILKKYPNIEFKNLMGNISNQYGITKTEARFYMAAEAWNRITNNSLSKEVIEDAYGQIFGGTNLDDYSDFINDAVVETQTSEPATETPTNVVKNIMTEKSEVEERDKFSFYLDVFLPLGIYLAIMQFPILMFIGRFFKNLIDLKNEETIKLLLCIFCFGVIGLLFAKDEIKNIKPKIFKKLYSEKSKTIHLISSLVIVAVTFYELSIMILLIFGMIFLFFGIMSLIQNFSTIKRKFKKILYK